MGEMRVRAFLFLVSSLAITDALAEPLLEKLGLVSSPPTLEELRAVQAKWESLRIEDYSFVISNKCVCPNLAHVGPLLITVRGGKVRSAVYMGAPRDGYSVGQAVRKRTPLRVSIDGLFERIEKQLRTQNPAHFKIKYEAGVYPVRLEYDNPALNNEESLILIKDLKRIN
jgi:hypothetical protein